ncbi:MAG: bifunctional DNA primase/polymerase [Acidobacteriia bacterium]|nr:bifunctional DNA primase/polymerase [Terriglobia bacterium]
MSSFLQIALSCIARGWHVFPCRGKVPMETGGYKNASEDEVKVREWWTRYPNANVGIAPGPSGLTVLDIDHGVRDEAHLREFLSAHDIPETFAVRTGRRPEFAVQLYYGEPIPSVGGWELGGCKGDVRGIKGHVMAAGSVHPDSGEPYAVLWDKPIAPVPTRVRALRAKPDDEHTVRDDNAPITEWRNENMIRLLGKARAAGLTDEEIRTRALNINERMQPPLDDEELERLITNACKFTLPEPEPIAVIGGSRPEEKKVTDWRELFHSKEDALNAPPITFLIKDFLQREGVTAIAGPVRERKSLIALNVTHALVSGEKLFDHFEVVRKPERVLYLCPEVSLGPFTDRLKKIGLIDYVGDTLFYRTLSADGTLKLNDPALEEALPGSVVILDTAVRFFEGDESSSQDARTFADSIFALLRAGAESVVMLHHSPKDAGEVMTLENAMRGSGDLGAFLACAWGTKLQDPSKPYESASFLSNLKQRDFESKDFEVTCTPDCRLHMVGDPETRPVTLQGRKGFKGNKDGKDDAAEAVIRASPALPVRKLQEQLAALNINRGTTWIAKARARLQADSGQAVIMAG